MDVVVRKSQSRAPGGLTLGPIRCATGRFPSRWDHGAGFQPPRPHPPDAKVGGAAMWVKIDDGILDNPKIASVGIQGFAVYVASIVFSARNLLDGFLPDSRWNLLLPQTEMTVADDLVRVGLWEKCPGGYRIHDFLKYNPSRARVLRLRARDRSRHRPESERNPSGIRAESTRSRSRISPSPVVSPNGEVPEEAILPRETTEQEQVPDELVEVIRRLQGLEGVRGRKKQCARVAVVARRYGAEVVKQALGEAEAKVAVADNPAMFLAGVCARILKARPPTMRESASRVAQRIERAQREGRL